MQYREILIIITYLKKYVSYSYMNTRFLIPLSERVSGSVIHKGIIIGRKRM